jgi:hypothetical protein
LIWLSEGKNKFDIKNNKEKKNNDSHHNFVSLWSLVVELFRRCCSFSSFDIAVVISGCSITIDGNCWFIVESFVVFRNGRSSSGARKFKLNLRILKRKQKLLFSEYLNKNLFFIAEPRDDLSLFDCFWLWNFLWIVVVVGSFSFVLAIDFHKNVFPTSSEKFITPVDVLI